MNLASKIFTKHFYQLVTFLAIFPSLLYFISCSNCENSKVGCNDDPSTIKVLFLITPEGFDSIPGATDSDKYSRLEVESANLIDEMNMVFINSGVNHRVELADGVKNSFRYVPVTTKSEADIKSDGVQYHELHSSYFGAAYPAECHNADLFSHEVDGIFGSYTPDPTAPARDNLGTYYDDYLWACKALDWLLYSQNNLGEVYDLRTETAADILFIMTTRFDIGPVDWGNPGVDCELYGPRTYKDSAATTLKGDDFCNDHYSDGKAYYCILDSEKGQTQPEYWVNDDLNGKCYHRMKTGGEAFQRTRGTNSYEAERPFITLSWDNRGSFPHELGHLIGLGHDPFADGLLINNVDTGFIHVEDNVPTSNFGGVGTYMAYNYECRASHNKSCYRASVFSNPSYYYTFIDPNDPNNIKETQLGINNNESFNACVAQQMGAYVSNFNDYYLNNYWEGNPIGNCNVSLNQIVSNVSYICMGGTIATNENFMLLTGCTVVDDDLTINPNVILDTSQKTINKINGDLVIKATSADDELIKFDALETIIGDLTIDISDGDAELNLPKLKIVKGNLTINSNSLTDFLAVAPLLETVEGNFNINLVDGVADLDFRGLRFVYGYLNITANNLNNLALNLVNLERVDGELKIHVGAGISMPNNTLYLNKLKQAATINLNFINNNLVQQILMNDLNEVEFLIVDLNTLKLIKLTSLSIVKNIWFNIENELNGIILVPNLKTVESSMVLQGNGIPYNYGDSVFHPLMGDIESINSLVLSNTLLETLGYNDSGNWSLGLQSLTNVRNLSLLNNPNLQDCRFLLLPEPSFVQNTGNGSDCNPTFFEEVE